MKTTKEIVIKRTGIEYTYDEEDKLEYIDLRITIYVPGFEDSTWGSDEDSWEYSAESDSWRCSSSCSMFDELPYGLAMFLGIDNTDVIRQVLHELTNEDREFITVKYTINATISPGHNLPLCHQCVHWTTEKNGFCNWCKQHLPADHVIPCSREVFKHKTTNNNEDYSNREN